MKNTFSKFLYLFNRREKFQLLVLLILIIIGALLETCVVGLIYPFISMLKSPEMIQENRVLRWAYSITFAKSSKEFIIWVTAGLIVVYLVKNTYSICLTYIQYKFTFGKQVSFSRRLFSLFLHQPYTFHLQRNTAELLQKLQIVVPSLFNSFLNYVLMLIVELITSVSIICLLFFVKPVLSIIVVGVAGVTTAIFYKITRRKVSDFGELRQRHGEQMIQWINQGLSGIKESKVMGREDFFIKRFDKNSRIYANAEQFIHVINQIPRPFLETVGIISMLLITMITIAYSGAFQAVIPTLSLFAMAAFRIMPSISRIFTATTIIRFNTYSLGVLYDDLIAFNEQVPFFVREVNDKKTDIPGNYITFNKTIELRDVRYYYPNTKEPAISNISLTIHKYQSVGFVGHSGAGKTTIVDLIIGLLTPTQGEVLVDSKDIKDNISSWQRRIGYIPQNIYLTDDTIQRNIAFGLFDDQIDEDKISVAVRYAQLEEFVNNLPERLNTLVGERGVRLSGGQRQRIGIARALYHNPDVLVMDEGTASLDNETEREVMQAIKRLSGEKTIIIIAHRLSTVKQCDKLYFIKDGKIISCGTYDELFNESLEFKAKTTTVES